MTKDKIVKALQKVTRLDDIHVEYPEREEYGDYSSNVALQMGKNSRKAATEIVAKLKKDTDLSKIVEKIEIAGPGFINFYLDPKFLQKKLEEIDEKFGSSDVNKNKKVIVEYSSPNIAKPFTVGHLRSTIIGDSIANILENTGYKVYRDNHIGDWGTQFGTLLSQISKIPSYRSKLKEWTVQDLVKLYIEFHKKAEEDETLGNEARLWFKKLEEGNKVARNIWQSCVEISWREFEKIYKILDVTFSEEFENGRGLGESFFENKMDSVIDELGKKKLLKTGEEGAKLVFFEKDKLPPLMIIKGDGATLYSTRDLATDKYRKENFNPDLIINEVGVEQSLYFRQIFEIEYLLEWYKPSQRIHVGHGHFRFKEGKMSTRKGNVIWLEDVIDIAIGKAYETRMTTSITGEHVVGIGRQKIDEDVAIGAIKYNDLKRDPKQDIIFDWDEMLNMQGNSGPYIQYTFARTQSVLPKAKSKSNKVKAGQLNNEELLILRTLVKFPEIVESAANSYSPNVICNYVYDLASRYNTFYNKHKIIDGENEGFRVELTKATGVVLKNGLNLLGIKAPEKM